MPLLKNFGYFLLWLILILYLSFTPLKDWPQPTIFQKLYIDKVVHLIMYSVLSFLLMRSIFQQQLRQQPRYETMFAALIFSAGIGVLIEILQPIITSFRRFEWMDMAANATGALSGILLFNWLLAKGRMGSVAAQDEQG